MQTDPAEHFMSLAIELSIRKMSENAGGPFGAIVVKDGQVISEGFNQVTSTNDPTAHAEMVAIRAACTKLNTFQLTECEIYTSCEPCPMCLGAIYWARPRAVYYANTRQDAASIGFDDQFIYDELPLPIDKRSIVMTQMMRDEAIKAFEIWQKKNDKVEY